jgi:outer membrane protein OmpA-like peptidoglycan-associated protein
MKPLYAFLSIFLTCLCLHSSAQNSENRLLIGLGAQGANMSFGDARSNYYKNWDVLPAISQIKVFSYVKKGFSWGWQLSISTAERNDNQESQFFLQWGIDIKYSLANGYILKEKSWFDPYLLIGGGLDKWGNTKGSINPGAGLNLWFTKNVGLFGQIQYNYLPHKKITPETADPRPSFMHHSFGIVVRLGKGKDSDGDGIPDAEDKCPNDPGKAELGGCPDTDGDGIIDKDDLCPTVAGLPEYGGCPDTDGDGIPDPDDACPTERGTKAMKGCPDRDGDGIADKDDQCPDQAGPAATMGCPDRDGDGIADRDDACPDERGPALTKGCPDTDGDGIIDKEDQCPTVFGVRENHGCPTPTLDAAEKTEVQKKLSFAAKNILFETGRDVIKKESLKELDSVAVVLGRYDFLKVTIEGHTDNVGADNINMALSMKRSEAVKSYLVSKGVVPTRLTATGYGPFKPLADNKTPEGRAKNRRVEINIKD